MHMSHGRHGLKAHLDRTCLLGRRSHIGIQWLDFPLPLVCYELELVAELGLCDICVGRVCLPTLLSQRLVHGRVL